MVHVKIANEECILDTFYLKCPNDESIDVYSNGDRRLQFMNDNRVCFR